MASVDASAEESWVKASQRPAKKAAYITSKDSMTTGWNVMPLLAAEIVGKVQLVRRARLDADRGAVQLGRKGTPSDFGTMKP